MLIVYVVIVGALCFAAGWSAAKNYYEYEE